MSDLKAPTYGAKSDLKAPTYGAKSDLKAPTYGAKSDLKAPTYGEGGICRSAPSGPTRRVVNHRQLACAMPLGAHQASPKFSGKPT
jgi:hypothetical protein